LTWYSIRLILGVGVLSLMLVDISVLSNIIGLSCLGIDLCKQPTLYTVSQLHLPESLVNGSTGYSSSLNTCLFCDLTIFRSQTDFLVSSCCEPSCTCQQDMWHISTVMGYDYQWSLIFVMEVVSHIGYQAAHQLCHQLSFCLQSTTKIAANTFTREDPY
jgi:hypothetical protein